MPGGVTFKSSLNADIPTPAAGKVTVYFSIDSGLPSYKDDTGTVHSLVGSAGSMGPPGITIFTSDGLQGEDGIFGVQGPPGPTGATGPAGSGSDLLSVLINITDAEWRALGTVPKTIVAAPGAGFILVPMFWVLIANITAGFSANPTLFIQWNGGTLPAGIPGAVVSSTTIHKRLTNSGWNTGDNAAAESTRENKALEFSTGSTLTGGTTNAGFNVTVYYQKVTIP